MDRLGEYLVRRLVGEGGMGKVYEAEERLSKRRVALKVLRDELTKSDHARRLFLNEMQILARLEHPNIVRSLASLEADGRLAIVLEYLEGQTLRQVLVQRERLDWQDASRIAASVAHALVAAHEQQPAVVHRDLKPENIMLLDDGSVKVMDFGIAKLLAQLDQAHTQTVGTLQYMSPEQIDAKPLDHRSDLYCLGLVLYELVAGKPPFQSASPRALLNMQCGQKPPTLGDEARQGIPRGIEQLLFQLLEKEAAARPASAREVAERLELFLPEVSPRGLAPPGAAPSPAAQPRKDAKPSPSPSPSDEGVSVPVAPSSRAADGDLSEPGTPESPSVEGSGDGSAPLDHVTDPFADHGKLDGPVSASSDRELPVAASVIIIVALMALAALLTYLVRS